METRKDQAETPETQPRPIEAEQLDAVTGGAVNNSSTVSRRSDVKDSHDRYA